VPGRCRDQSDFSLKDGRQTTELSLRAVGRGDQFEVSLTAHGDPSQPLADFLFVMKLSSCLSTTSLLVVTILAALHACDSTPADKIDNSSVDQEDVEKRPINDFFQPSPYYVSGDLRGFRLYPGAVPELFDELSLEEGDLVTEIDGSPLTEMGRAVELLKTLGSGHPVSVNVTRQGQSRHLLIQAQSIYATDAESPASDNRSIAQIINPVPYYEDGAMVGYRLYPGDSPEKFSELGLQAGDLLIELSEQDLAEIGVSYGIFENLSSTDSVELTFVRNGNRMTATIPAE